LCTRSARDVAGQAETGETQKAWGDCMRQVCRGQRGDWRLPETAETCVVWLITQRPQSEAGTPPTSAKTSTRWGDVLLAADCPARSRSVKSAYGVATQSKAAKLDDLWSC
jgi:hypothetical protein